ncbi:hypothetical protein [Pelobium manganitolerans]|uniref:hypothetical protein n=1 Tax=Pelobium manganitolerans TaxID=1842495 RepID=UPI003FA387BE
MKTLLYFFTLFISGFAFAQEGQHINYFTVKENLLKGEKLAIIATDSLDVPQEHINGVFSFSVNGFRQDLRFNDGVAVCPLQMEKSAFVFIKHINDLKSPSKIYYVYKKDSDLYPYAISWYILLIVPLGLILLGYLFRRLIGIVIFVLMLLFYFYYSKGLSIPTFFESIVDGIRNIF